MRIDKLKIASFKNLVDFEITFDKNLLTSVFIGKNGAGKSNLIEALIIIFRDLDLNIQTKEFSYEIYYKCLDNYIHIISNYESKKREFFIKKELTEKEEKCSVQKFYEKHADY